jgi:murein DD-endopeptidase MepM/ murein hydrolase activator NlpD
LSTITFHDGLDLVTNIPNAPIYAIADGTVVLSGWSGGYGNYVVIQHDATTLSEYAHNQSNLVRVG